MGGAKDGFAVAKRIGGMNVAFDYVVVHQTINHVGALAIRGTEHQRVPQQVALVAKGVDEWVKATLRRNAAFFQHSLTKRAL